MIIYQTTDSDGRNYHVSRAGQSLRLYTDDVFHTQYNPSRLYEDSLWDLLWLPVLAKTGAKANTPYLRILVLGVGGGAVMGKLRRVYPNALLVGVDLNPVHLKIAQDVFGVNHSMDLLLEADARAFVQCYKGPSFDVVIDDIFTEQGGEPVKAIALDNSWCQSLLRILTKKGLLISNFASKRDLQCSAPMQSPRVHFAERWQLRLPGYDNAIGAFFRAESFSSVLKDARTSGKKPRDIQRLSNVARRYHLSASVSSHIT